MSLEQYDRLIFTDAYLSFLVHVVKTSRVRDSLCTILYSEVIYLPASLHLVLYTDVEVPLLLKMPASLTNRASLREQEKSSLLLSSRIS